MSTISIGKTMKGAMKSLMYTASYRWRKCEMRTSSVETRICAMKRAGEMCGDPACLVIRGGYMMKVEGGLENTGSEEVERSNVVERRCLRPA